MSGGGIEALKGALFVLPKIENGTNGYPQKDLNDLTISVDRGICSFNRKYLRLTLSTVSGALRRENSPGRTIKAVCLDFFVQH